MELMAPNNTRASFSLKKDHHFHFCSALCSKRSGSRFCKSVIDALSPPQDRLQEELACTEEVSGYLVNRKRVPISVQVLVPAPDVLNNFVFISLCTEVY